MFRSPAPPAPLPRWPYVAPEIEIVDGIMHAKTDIKANTCLAREVPALVQPALNVAAFVDALAARADEAPVKDIVAEAADAAAIRERLLAASVLFGHNEVSSPLSASAAATAAPASSSASAASAPSPSAQPYTAVLSPRIGAAVPHSCCPNATLHIAPQLSPSASTVLSLLALVDIPAGTPISRSAVPLLQSPNSRKEALAALLGRECACLRCAKSLDILPVYALGDSLLQGARDLPPHAAERAAAVEALKATFDAVVVAGAAAATAPTDAAVQQAAVDACKPFFDLADKYLHDTHWRWIGARLVLVRSLARSARYAEAWEHMARLSRAVLRVMPAGHAETLFYTLQQAHMLSQQWMRADEKAAKMAIGAATLHGGAGAYGAWLADLFTAGAVLEPYIQRGFTFSV